jgi:phospholipase C
MQPHNPIDHVIIIVKENHTFDNYFGTFPGANGVATLQHASDPPAGGDPPHNHRAWLRNPTGVQQQYHESDIPAYFAYARQFALCDNFFTQVASQSEPNHLMLITADSPIIDNSNKKSRPWQPHDPFNLPSLPASLAKAKLSWKSYGDPNFNYFNHIAALKGSRQIASWKQFDTDAAAGKLPSVSWVYADGLTSEHPPYGKNAGKPTVRLGQQWTADRVSQVAKSALWSSTVIFITWDDWGGWYDHVKPPLKETWKGGGPRGAAYANSQFSYGPRVGCLVLSPYAKKGYISTGFHSHVSLVKFCETTFGLQPLTARDAAADDMSDCFDFKQTPLPPPGPTPTPSPGPKPKPKPQPKPGKGGSARLKPAAKKSSRKTSSKKSAR